jgi:hypothetical protein
MVGFGRNSPASWEATVGTSSGYICKSCGTRFSARDGGGFFFDLLHCDRCGKAASVGHQELGDIHLRFVKGLKVPYALARAAMDRRIQQEYPGEPLSRDGYHAASEATLDPCPCGGRFSYGAPPRCPTCASTSEMWDETGPTMFYD